ncbi:hypothetical protein FOMPIDRAFT_1055253 [Fomitopsis schrenkii]|uniref:Uncharacterized protein n=1 Tax=Fomitopsis schrenkii TaxID=2126942 RepID=S8DNQ0_FOMSC|nr:hypothetical protein FOMPIDRAFT_1055253 [Fomitopsis schrenkii]
MRVPLAPLAALAFALFGSVQSAPAEPPAPIVPSSAGPQDTAASGSPWRLFIWPPTQST